MFLLFLFVVFAGLQRLVLRRKTAGRLYVSQEVRGHAVCSSQRRLRSEPGDLG